MAATLALALTLSPAAAAPTPDVAIQLLGWSPDGVRYAFVRHRITHLEDGRVERSERTFLREVDEDLTERTLPLSDEEVREAVAAEGFVAKPLARRPAGELAWVFTDDEGTDRLRFTVLVGESLSWELATRGADGVRRSLAARPIDALYVDFEADVFIAPGGGRALLLVGMRAPFRYGAELLVVPLDDGPLPLGRPDPVLPAAAGPDEPTAEPVLEPGDVIVDWRETDAVVPVVEEPLPDTLAAALAGEAPAEEPAAEAPLAEEPAEVAPAEEPAEAAAEEPAEEPAEVAAEAVAPTEPPPPATDAEAAPPDPLDLPPVAVEPAIRPPFREPDDPPAEAEQPESTPPAPVELARAAKPAPAPKPAAGKPDQPPAAGTIRLVGFVKSGDIYQGKPIAGAKVVLSTGQVLRTDRRGMYEAMVLPGTVTVTASAKGYETWSETKELEPGEPNWKSLALVRPGTPRPAPTPAPSP